MYLYSIDINYLSSVIGFIDWSGRDTIHFRIKRVGVIIIPVKGFSWRRSLVNREIQLAFSPLPSTLFSPGSAASKFAVARTIPPATQANSIFASLSNKTKEALAKQSMFLHHVCVYSRCTSNQFPSVCQ